jgi:hypothetical protein
MSQTRQADMPSLHRFSMPAAQNERSSASLCEVATRVNISRPPAAVTARRSVSVPHGSAPSSNAAHGHGVPSWARAATAHTDHCRASRSEPRQMLSNSGKAPASTNGRRPASCEALCAITMAASRRTPGSGKPARYTANWVSSGVRTR